MKIQVTKTKKHQKDPTKKVRKNFNTKKSISQPIRNPQFVAKQNPITKEWIWINQEKINVLDLISANNSKQSLSTNRISPEKGKELLNYSDKDEWTLKVVNVSKPNNPKFKERHTNSPYKTDPDSNLTINAILLNINQSFENLHHLSITEVLDSIQERYLSLTKDRKNKTISFIKDFFPWSNLEEDKGLYMIASPYLSKDYNKILKGSKNFFNETNKCAHCVLLDHEKAENKRIILENKDFITLHPEVPGQDFEIKIYPKEHQPYFEKIRSDEKMSLAKILKDCLKKLSNKLNKTPYQINLYTSPCDGLNYNFNHWYLSVVPLLSQSFSCYDQVNTIYVNPDLAAKYLNQP